MRKKNNKLFFIFLGRHLKSSIPHICTETDNAGLDRQDGEPKTVIALLIIGVSSVCRLREGGNIKSRQPNTQV